MRTVNEDTWHNACEALRYQAQRVLDHMTDTIPLPPSGRDFRKFGEGAESIFAAQNAVKLARALEPCADLMPLRELVTKAQRLCVSAVAADARKTAEARCWQAIVGMR